MLDVEDESESVDDDAVGQAGQASEIRILMESIYHHDQSEGISEIRSLITAAVLGRVAVSMCWLILILAYVLSRWIQDIDLMTEHITAKERTA